MASLDSLTLYPRQAVVTRTVGISPPSRLGVSVTAGPALTPRGLTWGVTVGVSYCLWRR